MKTEHIHGPIIAITPIHHGGDESTGARATLRRMKYLVDGKRVEIPVISGNAIRGVLRRLIMAHMLETLGYGKRTEEGEADDRMKSMKAYHMLFSGGTLESVEDSGAIDLALRRELRTSLPALSVFGSAIGNQMIEGKMKCGIAVPVCTELAAFQPGEQATNSIYELLTDDFTTRKDDLHGEREEGEAAHQMIVNFECFAPGTTFVHKFSLLDCTDVERAILDKALQLWTARPYIGGKSSIGYGEVKLSYLSEYHTEAYDRFLVEQADKMRATIEKIEGILG